MDPYIDYKPGYTILIGMSTDIDEHIEIPEATRPREVENLKGPYSRTFCNENPWMITYMDACNSINHRKLHSTNFWRLMLMENECAFVVFMMFVFLQLMSVLEFL